MFENRNLQRDLLALALLALLVFLSLALVTYHRADAVTALAPPMDRLYQPDRLVYPQNDETANACGQWGAFAADLLLTSLGVGAFYLVASLAILDIALLRRRQIDGPVLRSFGWLVSLVGVTAIASMTPTALAAVLPSGWGESLATVVPGPVVGSGGYLGAIGSGMLQTRFNLPGACILAAAVTLIGLLMATDYALLRMAAVALGVFLGLIQRRRAAIGPKRAKKQAAAAETEDEYEELEEEEGEYEEDEQEQAVPIRIGGKRTARTAEVEEEAEEEVDEVEQEDADDAEDQQAEQEQEEEPTPVVRRKNKKSGKGKGAAAPHFLKRTEADEKKRQEVMSKLDEASQEADLSDYDLPSLDLLLEGDDFAFDEQEKEVRRKARILEKTFAEFGFKVKVVEIETGPVIAQYEVQLEAGLRLSKITGLAEDLAIALRVPSVRIVAPIPGKNTVGIEVPNEHRQVVRLRDVMEEAGDKARKMRIPIFLGKDVSGNPLTVDLSTLPHLLIAGRTGTGKSVCLNAIISSILMTRRPDEVRLLLIDPKMVELSGYGRLPHLMHPVVTDMRKAEAILAWAVEKMEERYSLLAKAGVRHIASYNQLGEEELFDRLEIDDPEQRKSVPTQLPFIVIVADEMADLMMTAGKEVEQHIIRLAQKSRAVGIHLILATQKPTVDVITGLIKSNLPARVAFQVASRTDSRVVLDEMGADKLLGNGDMLFLWPGTSTLLRGQGTYLSDDEIQSVTDCVSTGEQQFVHELVNLSVEEGEGGEPGALKNRDELYESAVDIVVREGRGSVSLLQRSLGIGYGRAARLIDFMAEDGIVGAYAGSQAREVKLTAEDWAKMQGLDPDEAGDGGADDADEDLLSTAVAAPAGGAKRPPRISFASQAEEDAEDEEEEEEDAFSDDEEEEDGYEDDFEEDADEDAEDEYEEEEHDEAEDEVDDADEEEEPEEDEYEEEDEYDEDEDEEDEYEESGELEDDSDEQESAEDASQDEDELVPVRSPSKKQRPSIRPPGRFRAKGA
ncbi:MAG: DNA translocase FtsK 4TM domain-containing protein [Pirellulaceae bacterium]